MKNALIIAIVLILGVAAVAAFTRETPVATEDHLPVDAPVTPNYATPVINPNARVMEFVVDGKNFAFTPSSIKVNQGDTVRIVFKNSGGVHDFVIDEFGVATKQIRTDEQETVTFTADKTGTFEYYCSVGTHRSLGMVGSLIVE